MDDRSSDDFIRDLMREYADAVEPSRREIVRMDQALGERGLLEPGQEAAGPGSWTAASTGLRTMLTWLGAGSIVAVLGHAVSTPSALPVPEFEPSAVTTMARSSKPAATAADDGSSPPRFVEARMEPATRSGDVDMAPVDATPPARARLGLRDELESLALVQRWLVAGEYRHARTALDDHRRRFEHGVLRAEADGLCVVIECRRRRAGSSGRARRFLAHNPAHPLARRISEACRLSGNNSRRGRTWKGR